MTFEGGGTGDTPLMAWNRLGSLFALHSASYQGAFDESAFSCSYFGLEQLVTLSGSLPGSVPAVAVRPTSSSMCLLASSIAAGCTFCSQRRFKVIAAVKVPIASREKLLAGKQEVAEVAEVAGDAERVHNGGSKATGSPPLVHREARSEQAANSSKSSRLRVRAILGGGDANEARSAKINVLRHSPRRALLFAARYYQTKSR